MKQSVIFLLSVILLLKLQFTSSFQTARAVNLSNVHRSFEFNHGINEFTIHHPRRNAQTQSKLYVGFFNDMIKGFQKRMTMKAKASHILMKGPEAEKKLEELKAEIDNSPTKFAEYAAQYSTCPSAKNGGYLGEFGPGQMVKRFDDVVFNEAVGEVHGPVGTQFGYHLIYIQDRTE